MRKQILSLTLAFCMVISLFAALPMAASAAAGMGVGDYVQMGTYYGQPILWRCVSFEKISGYDTNGNPIMDSTDTRRTYAEGYLPLMLADKILCLKAFDASGDNTSGSHGRGLFHGEYRQIKGSNNWGDSNLRDWLNSAASAGDVVWSCGNPPDEEEVGGREFAYDQEAGFLTNFTPSERTAMQTVTQKSLLDGYEYPSEGLSYNVDYHRFDDKISNIVQNYDTACSELVTDTVFLLDVKQINTVYNNSNILGNDYYIGEPTAECVANLEYMGYNRLQAGQKWNTWLRSPDADYNYSDHVRYIIEDGDVGALRANYNRNGVRPAFYLDASVNFAAGEGMATDPYVLRESGQEPLPQSTQFASATYRETASGYKFYIEFEHDIDAASIIVAGYWENQKMVSCVLTECDGDSYYIVTLPKENPITSAKVFVWDPDALEPLGESETFLIGG